jgi:dihydrolipoamide dehydrogenase
MSETTYDLVVIGGGPAGYMAAIRAAQLGMKTACVEKRVTLGGTCLNVGCIPSKALLDSSEHYHVAAHKFAKHGILLDGLKLDIPAMQKRKDAVVRQLTTGIAGLFKKHKIDSIQALGTLEGVQGELKIIRLKSDGAADRTIQAKNVLLATGSEPAPLKSLPFDGKRVVSSTEALTFEHVPKSLIVVGGGVIGLELSSVWARLGSKVTVVEFSERIIPSMDTQMGKELQKSLTKLGIEFRLNTEVTGAKVNDLGVDVEVKDRASGESNKLAAEIVLVSAGRIPYTWGLGLEKAGVLKDERGRVKIDANFRTNVSGIYAVGDIVAGPMLAHKAEEEGVAAVEIMAGQHSHVNYDAIPSVVYTWPEVASVGLSEEQAKERGLDFKVGSFPFMANGRAKAMDETEGLVKVIADAKTDKVLGVHIIAARAGDLIAEAVTVIEYGGSAEDIARTSHSHPSLSEALKEAALAVDKRTRSM